MEIAPATHRIVPAIFAKPLISRRFSFSYPARNEMRKVIAGMMLPTALPIDDEVK
jgi:hypothetical protein